MAASYVLNTKVEFLKSKRTAAFWLTVIGAGFIPVINFIRLVARPDVFTVRMKTNPWEIIIRDNWQVSTAFLWPIYVILVTSMLVQIEYKNNTWKQVYTSPRSTADIFFSKFLVTNTLIILCFLAFNISIILLSYLNGLIDKRYMFSSHAVPWAMLWALMWKIYVSVLSVTAIQYWLSLRIRNFIVPVGIGLAMLISAFILNSWDQLYLHPYIYPAIFYWPNFKHLVNNAEISNVIWFVIVITLSYLDTVNRKERG
jgi:hypothetical protein